MSKTFWDHPIETIEKVLHIRRQIEALERNLNEIYSGTVPHVTSKKVDGRNEKRSAVTHAKMADAQNARWVKKNAASPAAPAVEAAKQERVARAASQETNAAAENARWSKKEMNRSVNPVNNLMI
jgi:hypothetical protein